MSALRFGKIHTQPASRLAVADHGTYKVTRSLSGWFTVDYAAKGVPGYVRLPEMYPSRERAEHACELHHEATVGEAA